MSRSIRCAAVAALLLLAAPVFSLDWPVQNGVITGTFGEDRGDHLHAGIDIGGAGDVHPVLPGELLFRYDEGADYSSLPRGTGSTVALHHDQNILSLYFHLQSGSLGPARRLYAPTDRIGSVGDTGRSEGKHLHFAVYDEETRSWINPLTFLPPLADTQPPVIRQVFLSIGDQRQPLANGVAVKPGTGSILAEAADLREDVRFYWPMAPYSVVLSLDGTQVARIVFDSLQVKAGRMVVSGTMLGRDDLYGADGLLRCGSVELRPGESRLRLVVSDYAGNEATKEIALTVRE